MDLLARKLGADDIAELLALADDHLPARTRCRECGRRLMAGHCMVRMGAIGALVSAGQWPIPDQDQPTNGAKRLIFVRTRVRFRKLPATYPSANAVSAGTRPARARERRALAPQSSRQ